MTPDESRSEHPSAYIVEDRSNRDEMKRLVIQDRLLTQGMGGVLAEHLDPTCFRRVLDVGCGSGGWLIDLTRTSPTSVLYGVDVSTKVVKYARAQAEEQQASDRITFHVMDALRMLEFPNAFFDLVNLRLGSSWLRTWEWHKLLSECRRVIRPGGSVRLTEATLSVESTSSALTGLCEQFVTALYQSGHLPTPQSGIITHLAYLLEQYGWHPIQTHSWELDYQHETPLWHLFAQERELFLRTSAPFLRKWTRVSADYEARVFQAMAEIRDPSFVGKGAIKTVWGSNGCAS